MSKVVLLLFGLPCTGKTTLAQELSTLAGGALLLSVDHILRELLGREPGKVDFRLRAPQVIDKLLQRAEIGASLVIIEMGCLIPRTSAEYMTIQFAEKFKVISVELSCSIDLSRERALRRNAAVMEGRSDAVLIDNPDCISEFQYLYERPNAVTTFLTDTCSSTLLAKRIFSTAEVANQC